MTITASPCARLTTGASDPAGRARLNRAQGKLLSSHAGGQAERRRGRTSLDKPPAIGWDSEETSEPRRTTLILALTRRKPLRTSDLVGPAQLADLALQRLEPLTLLVGQPRPQPVIGLGATDPLA
jgi:hypothetical protein